MARIYTVTDHATEKVQRFTNKAVARRAYKAAQKSGKHVTAETWREYEGGSERLDRNGTPDWAL